MRRTFMNWEGMNGVDADSKGNCEEERGVEETTECVETRPPVAAKQRQ